MKGLPTSVKTCKCGVASAGDDVVATASTIGTDSDDTADVAASTAGLPLLQFNQCIRALELPNNCLG